MKGKTYTAKDCKVMLNGIEIKGIVSISYPLPKIKKDNKLFRVMNIIKRMKIKL